MILSLRTRRQVRAHWRRLRNSGLLMVLAVIALALAVSWAGRP